jgi:uncharacterized protein (TIGR02145 family)
MVNKKKLFLYLGGIIFLLGFLIAYNTQIPNPGHGGDSVLVFINGFSMTLQEAINHKVLGDISATESYTTQIPNPGHEGDNILVSIDGFEMTLQQAIDFKAFCTSEILDCVTHSTLGCYDNDAYWFDSCGVMEEKEQECAEGCFEGECVLNDENFSEIIDTRDGKSYKIVKIGTQYWMAEGLRYDNGCLAIYNSLPSIIPGDVGACMKPISGDGWGYQWSAAMDGSIIEGAQGLCPEGWHIPTHDEWTILERAVCTSEICETDFPYDKTTSGFRGTNEGAKLKEGGSSGFGAIFNQYLSTQPGFWVAFISSTQSSNSNDWARLLTSSSPKIVRGTVYKKNFQSVRCVKEN